ncbi:hypothetical protein CVT25_001008 [Psilocybe cyanescens]|uniref:BZIP domain-containing protein n=1 Tax=Psilocybe cyanescens TaxID=93625 RepID=A0A409XBI8_PSICY|nr:hypothetical protein CVT25_001008 [Psilocybe cyanescens]
MGMKQMNLTLHAKEQRKQPDCAVLFPGAEKRRLENEKKEKKLAKEQRKAAKANKKALKQQLEEQWKEVCHVYDAAVAAWEIECLQLKGIETVMKDLPKKPKQALKKSLVEKETAGESNEEESESSDDD